MITSGENLHVSGIYCAIHRESGRCYIGSSKDIATRRLAHIHLSQTKTRACGRFYYGIKTLGLESFDLELIEAVEPQKLLEREEFWIGFYKSASLWGFNSVAKPTRIIYGLKRSNRTREILSQKSKARFQSPAVREQCRLKQLGKKHRPETLAKISFISSNQSVETRKKIGLSSRGRKDTERARLNRIAAQAALSPEAKERRAKLIKERPQWLLARISDGQKARAEKIKESQMDNCQICGALFRRQDLRRTCCSLKCGNIKKNWGKIRLTKKEILARYKIKHPEKTARSYYRMKHGIPLDSPILSRSESASYASKIRWSNRSVK